MILSYNKIEIIFKRHENSPLLVLENLEITRIKLITVRNENNDMLIRT